MYDLDDDDYDCPLCMEELDLADRNFKPCPCGYQICRFCWNHIKENINGRCPACRREYSDKMVEFHPISNEEMARVKREKREKDRQHKDMEAANRKHLANMRVVQKNLVYVIGLNPKTISEEDIRSHVYFGQFGKIAKVVINKRPALPASSSSGGGSATQASIAVYVTYHRKEDAAKAIYAVDGKSIGGRTIRASYGTTKYCTYYLRNMDCPNPSCLYLHEPGEEADTISKEELATGKHRMRDQMSTDNEDEKNPHPEPPASQPHASPFPSLSDADFPTVAAAASQQRKPVAAPVLRTSTRTNTSVLVDEERSALPATASWAKHGSIPSTPVLHSSELIDRTPMPSTDAVALHKSHAISPTKRKDEKRKQNNEQVTDVSLGLRSECSDATTATTDTSHSSRPVTPGEEGLLAHNMRQDGLAEFVLGDACRELCPLVSSLDLNHPESELGLLKLHDGTGKESNTEDSATSVLDFLLQNSRQPVYSGEFNPFVHYISSSFRETSARKHSRFGFAQK